MRLRREVMLEGICGIFDRPVFAGPCESERGNVGQRIRIEG